MTEHDHMAANLGGLSSGQGQQINPAVSQPHVEVHGMACKSGAHTSGHPKDMSLVQEQKNPVSRRCYPCCNIGAQTSRSDDKTQVQHHPDIQFSDLPVVPSAPLSGDVYFQFIQQPPDARYPQQNVRTAIQPGVQVPPQDMSVLRVQQNPVPRCNVC